MREIVFASGRPGSRVDPENQTPNFGPRELGPAGGFLGKTTLGWTSFSAVQFRSKKWPSTFSGLFKALTVRATHFSIHGRWKIRLGQSGFHKCFIHIKYSVTSANFHFLHETLRREKESVSPWRNLWAQFHMRWKLCGTPLRHK
jgi:hypothetical protein